MAASLERVRNDLERRELRARRGEPLSPFLPPPGRSMNAMMSGALGDDDDEEGGDEDDDDDDDDMGGMSPEL